VATPGRTMRFLERPPGSASLRFSHAALRTRKALSSSMIVPASEAPTKGRRLRPSLKPLTRSNQGGSRPSGGVPYSSPISPQSSASPPSAGQNSPKTRPSSPESNDQAIRRTLEAAGGRIHRCQWRGTAGPAFAQRFIDEAANKAP